MPIAPKAAIAARRDMFIDINHVFLKLIREDYC